VVVGIAVIVVLAAIGIGIGASITGGDVTTPVTGTLVLGLYAIALAGIGIAIGGLVSTGAAAPAVAILTVLIWLIDIIAPPLGLPDAVQQLALTAHYGQPMLGVWDPAGIVASVVLAVGGVAIGALGFARRDLRA
jgi:putative exporter of polyketide antibiotics